jgi:hypothetical protein
MSIRHLAMVLAPVMLGIFLGTGCSSSNEEAITGPTPVVPQEAGAPAITTYGDAVKHSDAQAKAKAGEAKAASKKQ